MSAPHLVNPLLTFLYFLLCVLTQGQKRIEKIVARFHKVRIISHSNVGESSDEEHDNHEPKSFALDEKMLNLFQANYDDSEFDGF